MSSAAVTAVLSGASSAFYFGQSLGITDPLTRPLAYGSNFSMPNLLPSAAQIMGAYRAGTLNEDLAKIGFKMNGVFGPTELLNAEERAPGPYRRSAQLWESVYRSSLLVPSPGELLALLNRGAITDRTAGLWLRRQGYVDTDVQAALLSLRFAIPGPADLIRFAVKDVWVPEIVNRYRYDAEFPAEFRYWMERQGMGADARTQAQRDAGLPGVTWPQLYWREHWQNLAPTQTYVMYQRLRRNRLARLGPDFAGMRPFTFEDLQYWLKINDYPEPVRSWLAAIAYNPPRLVDIDRFYQQGEIDAAEVYELHLDRGYSPGDARVRTDWLVNSFQRWLSGRMRGGTQKQILNAYRLGLYTRGQAAALLYSTALVGTKWLVPFNRLDQEGKEAFAQAVPAVSLALYSEDVRERHDLARQTLSTLRSQYLRGQLGDDTAIDRMTRVGITRERAERHVQRWALLRSGRRLLATVGQIQRWVRYGYIPIDVGRQWLANLGWDATAREAILLDVRRNQELDRARERAAAARTAAQQRAAQEAIARAAERIRQKALRELNRQASAAQIRRYFLRGIISNADYRRALAARGYTNDEIDRRIAEAEIDRQRELEREAKRRAGITE